MEGIFDKRTGLRLFLSTVFVLFSILNANATHLRAGQIIAERIGCTMQFRITVTVFTDTESGIHFGGDEDFLDFGDGTIVKVPDTDHTKIDGNVPNLGTASYTIIHTYPGPGTYIISYIEPNRNDHILNIDNSVNTRFYIESKIIIDPFLESVLGCNSTPVLLVPPIDQGCTGKAFYHNPGAYDPDGDSLSYEFVTPFKARGTVVDNFRFPDLPEFYTSLDYNTSNEDRDGPPDITIDPVNGNIVWDAPGMAGEYNIAFVVREWRKKDGIWYPLGFVRRDMQIIISDCDNDRPELIIPNDTCIVAGTTLEALIRGTDPNNDRVKIEAYSEILNFDENAAYYTPFPPDYQLTDPEAELNFYWNTTCDHVKDQPYQVVFKITDDPPTGPRLVTFEAWNITVVAPAPQWVDVTVDLAKRHASLEWEPYQCAQEVDNVQLQVWRRVDAISFTPENCQVGMPEYLGYELIATLGANQNTYLDTNKGMGLAVGAKYCYRLVAVFPAPAGGLSYVSEEMCVDPILADAPVITNVSVERTGTNDGEVFVKWLPPFDIDLGQFPKPHKYVVERAESLAGPFVASVHPGQLDDIVTEVTDIGLDTEDRTYYYRILLYVPSVSTTVPVDTSSIASTVRLELKPQKGMIDLIWGAFVPWSNMIQTSPNHDVYRGDEGAKINSDLAFYDQVNVFVNGQMYSDDGSAIGVPLEDTKLYCYQVVTRGGYGNPGIPEPLINYSQIICAQPKDSIPPCAPKLIVDITDCEEFIALAECDFSEYENTLRWSKPEDECANDIAGYRVYASALKNGQFQLIQDNVRDTFFIDKSLSSYARCYKISSVDRSGNESELSGAVCNENCPYYELPNVFTPNGDSYNNLFSAFSLRGVAPCESEPCQGDSDYEYLKERCARFVQKVNLKVFNRWGKEVYTFESGGENSIYIDWDGRDNNGRELPSAVYFYSAEVTFYAADPDNRVKVFKGWVHLVR